MLLNLNNFLLNVIKYISTSLYQININVLLESVSGGFETNPKYCDMTVINDMIIYLIKYIPQSIGI